MIMAFISLDSSDYKNSINKIGDLFAQKNTKIEEQAAYIARLEETIVDLLIITDKAELTREETQVAYRARVLVGDLIEPLALIP
jgi:hypothetical protein